MFAYLARVRAHARNRDGRGEREEEQARRSRGSKQRSFLSWGIHCLIVRSILLRAFVMQCIERIGHRPSPHLCETFSRARQIQTR